MNNSLFTIQTIYARITLKAELEREGHKTFLSALF